MLLVSEGQVSRGTMRAVSGDDLGSRDIGGFSENFSIVDRVTFSPVPWPKPQPGQLTLSGGYKWLPYIDVIFSPFKIIYAPPRQMSTCKPLEHQNQFPSIVIYPICHVFFRSNDTDKPAMKDQHREMVAV